MINEIYEKEKWNSYARCHASVLSSFQLELFLDAVKHLSGDIADFGCGSARLAPFLADQERVSSYTGVDSASEMVSIARNLIGKLSSHKLKIVNSRIEDIHQKFTSAVSIHSYYSWPQPEEVLSHIFELLIPGSIFLLATPNSTIDMPKLLAKAERELLCHPDYIDFKNFNMQFVSNPNARFVSLDELIQQVQGVGFEAIECNQKYYLGGVNFLLLKKP